MGHYDEDYEDMYDSIKQGLDEAIKQVGTKCDRNKPVSTNPVNNPVSSPSKYNRELRCGKTLDVYDVLDAFRVENPAIQHALKKMLCTGSRGHKNYQEDIQEAIDSLERAKSFPPIPF